MRVTYAGHASVLVESKDFNFMCDPWVVGDHINNCAVWLYPPRRVLGVRCGNMALRLPLHLRRLGPRAGDPRAGVGTGGINRTMSHLVCRKTLYGERQ